MSSPHKRARADCDNTASDTGPDDASNAMASAKSHPDLWFDDGSIILVAEQTMFKVHRSTLCIHSNVFTDMFGIPQPSDDITLEKCPIVRMPDPAKDVACLLKTLYDPL